MSTFFAMVIAFCFFLILTIIAMVFAYWPEKYFMRDGAVRKLIQVKPNDLCPCGSKRKAKKCCGAGKLYQQTRNLYRR